MLLAIACLFATVAAGPVLYDQRQDGEVNTQVDISNVLLLFAIPKKVPMSLFDLLSKNVKVLNGDSEMQDRADVRVMEAFVEPNTPYRVEIGANERSDDGDGRAVEVVIAGRRRLEVDQPESEEQDDLKLLGATENCGPDRVRDSVTLMCRDIQPVEVSVEPEPELQKEQTENKADPAPAAVPEPTPEVVPS